MCERGTGVLQLKEYVWFSGTLGTGVMERWVMRSHPSDDDTRRAQ